MSKTRLTGIGSFLVLVAAAWLGSAGQAERARKWTEVAPGVLRSSGLPACHALVDGDRVLLVDAPVGIEGLKEVDGKKIDLVLLTHHHWDTCAAAEGLLKAGVPVRAPQKSAEWLTPDNVRKHWQESIPLRHSRASYLVVPAGLEGVDCSLQDKQEIAWKGWTIQVVATPGHARDHVAYAARRGKDDPLVLLAGDAIAAPGKLWAPYTTDWNHWTDEGLKPAGESLRKLAALKPAIVLPAHGPPIAKDADKVLADTAARVEEAGFLKSFERYTKQRLGNPPQYAFLAKDQVASGGKLPWTQVSARLFITGNTYVLTSKDGPFLAIDPWGQLSADQIAKLKKDRNLGALEVVLVSHAHFDHYDGVYVLPERDKLQVWTLDKVAAPIDEPLRWRAPFLDARPVKVDRKLKDGEAAAWREYRFRFHHFPGQTDFTMAVETTIDGKKCLFTADNFFHQDQFSGSGGWMGLNRSWPLPYAASAQKVVDLAPDWVLAEHGGPFEYSAEDFKRRVRWGQAAAAAADAISPSGDHRRDWDPNRLTLEPLVQKAKPGATIEATLKVHNPLPRAEKLAVTVPGRGHFADLTLTVDVPAKGSAQRELRIKLSDKLPAGRHVFEVRAVEDDVLDGADGFLIVDVE